MSAQGVSPDLEKTDRVRLWAMPYSALEVQQFMGLINYYHKFIKDFTTMAKPLHRLTEKRVIFIWTFECENAFNALKTRLTSAPILALYWTMMPSKQELVLCYLNLEG